MSHPVYGNGTTSEANARDIIEAVWAEFPALHAVFQTPDDATDAAEELLLRTIWHLHQAGYTVGRQKNPSGLISNDKFTIQFNGTWHWIDIYTLGWAGHATTLAIQEFKTEGAQHVPDKGIADGAQPTPVPEPVPHTTPPHIGYPGDQIGFAIGTPLFADYDAAHVPPNPGMGVWFWRTAWDIAQGEPAEAAIARHRKEWRTALGLPPLP